MTDSILAALIPGTSRNRHPLFKTWIAILMKNSLGAWAQPQCRTNGEMEDSPRQRTRSRYAESLGQTEAPSYSEEPVKSKSKGAAVFFKTKEIFGRYEKPVTHRVPSIEAWLDEQPDPFVDNGAEIKGPAVEVPEPLRKRTRTLQKGGAVTKTAGADPNKIWDSVTERDGEQDDATRRRDSSWNFGDESPVKDDRAAPRPISRFTLEFTQECRSSAKIEARKYHLRKPPRTWTIRISMQYHHHRRHRLGTGSKGPVHLRGRSSSFHNRFR